jgi:hypothetical protein
MLRGLGERVSGTVTGEGLDDWRLGKGLGLGSLFAQGSCERTVNGYSDSYVDDIDNSMHCCCAVAVTILEELRELRLLDHAGCMF